MPSREVVYDFMESAYATESEFVKIAGGINVIRAAKRILPETRL